MSNHARRLIAIFLEGIHTGAIGLLPVVIGIWVYIPLLRLSYPPVYFTYSSILLFGSDLLILLALGAELGLRALTGTFRIQRPRGGILGLLGLAAWAILSAAWSIEPRLSAAFGFHLLGLIGVILSLRGRSQAWRAFSLGCMAGILLQSSIAAVEVLTQSTAFLEPLRLEWPGRLDPSIRGAAVIELPGGPRWLRAYGTLPHPNLLGLYLVGMMAGPAAWSLRQSQWALIGQLGFGLAAFGLGLSFSRAAWLGFGAGLLWLLRTPHLPLQHRALLPLIGAAGLLLSIGLFPTATAIRLTGGGSPLEARSIKERQWLMEQALHQIRAHLLLGTGAGTFPLVLREGLPSGYRAEPVHQVGMLMIAELGLPGILLGLGALWACLGERRRKEDPEARALEASLIGLVVLSMLDHPLWTLAPARTLAGALLGAWLGRQGTEEPMDPLGLSGERSGV